MLKAYRLHHVLVNKASQDWVLLPLTNWCGMTHIYTAKFSCRNKLPHPNYVLWMALGSWQCLSNITTLCGRARAGTDQ